MKCGHLFAGINGFGLASDAMGWETEFNCEIDKFCQTILKYYWPNTELYGDIKTTDFTIWRNRIDLLTGGFPCQPFSTAGKRKGTADDRSLWPEMYRAVREIQPAWVVAENVPGLLNWGKGLVFEQVQTDLESEGYEVQPLIIPAAGLNAPHKRDRIWFIAYNTNTGVKSMQSEEGNSVYETGFTPNSNNTGCKDRQCLRQNVPGGNKERRNPSDNITEIEKQSEDVTDTKKQRFQKRNAKQVQYKTHSTIKRYNCISQWKNFPTQPPICSRDDGLSSGLSRITFSKHRRESIKAFGNAIVPQIALEIFKAIEETDKKLL